MMTIKSMTATFGNLERARLTCAPGLNLIQAPNEGGKSTWCAFYRAMLPRLTAADAATREAAARALRMGLAALSGREV